VKKSELVEGILAELIEIVTRPKKDS